MVLLSIGLIIIGILTAFAGLGLFRLLLPLVGFISGIMVGFGGTQAVFGNGAVSTTIAVVMALVTGALMAVLSFLFFEVAVVVLSIIVGMSAMSYLTVAIGLGENGFILFMMTLAGAILGFVIAAGQSLSRTLVIVVTSFVGVSYLLAGIMLLAGSVSLEQLNDGIVRTVVGVVDQEFLWLLAWLGGSILAINVQRSIPDMMLTDAYAFEAPKKSVK
jgi:hypothetical protein